VTGVALCSPRLLWSRLRPAAVSAAHSCPKAHFRQRRGADRDQHKATDDLRMLSREIVKDAAEQ